MRFVYPSSILFCDYVITILLKISGEKGIRHLQTKRGDSTIQDHDPTEAETCSEFYSTASQTICHKKKLVSSPEQAQPS